MQPPLQHGAYALLLDHYYSTGKPLPANASRLQTICRAFAPHDVDAMHSVMSEFFVQDGDVYRNLRADEELLKHCNISEKRRGAAHARHANAPAKGGAFAPAIADTSTVELTNVSSRRGTRLPNDWTLPIEWSDWAIANGLTAERLPREGLTFSNYWHAKAGKDAVKLDWFKTWQNWVNRAIDQTSRGGARPEPRRYM